LPRSDSTVIGQSLGDLKELTVTHIDVHTHTHTNTQRPVFLGTTQHVKCLPFLVASRSDFKYCPLDMRTVRARDVSICHLETVTSRS